MEVIGGRDGNKLKARTGWYKGKDIDDGNSMRLISGRDGNKLEAETGEYAAKEIDGNGSDDYGFSALPGGSYNHFYNRFVNAGYFGFWWLAAEFDFSYAGSICF